MLRSLFYPAHRNSLSSIPDLSDAQRNIKVERSSIFSQTDISADICHGLGLHQRVSCLADFAEEEDRAICFSCFYDNLQCA